MRPFLFTVVLVAAGCGLASWLVAGCSLDGFVFDLPDPSGGAGGGASASSSSSGGGSGISSSSSGGGSASSSSSSGAPSEDCLNSVDDDNDGAVDCDDSDCGDAGYTCFPAAAPSGWSGPVVLYHGDPDQVPGCPGGYPTLEGDGNIGLMSSPVTCDACSCTGVNLDCLFPALSGNTDNACATPGSYSFGVLSGSMCGSAAVSGLMSFSAKSPGIDVTGCSPMGGGVKSAPPPSWSSSARVCSAEGFGACSSGDVCAPPSPAPFHANQCVVRFGSMGGQCPAPYTDRHDIMDPNTLSDNRGCSACSCTSPNQFSCDLTYELYSDLDCMGSVTKVVADGTCVAPGAAVSAQSYKAVYSYNGTCSAQSGGQPTGSFSVTKAMTVCCLP